MGPQPAANSCVAASRGDFSRRITKGPSPEGTPWLWTLAFGHHEDRTPTLGYAATREAAMAAFRQETGGRE